MVSYIHAGVFVPTYNYSPEQLQRFTFRPLTNPEMHLAYWDEQAYVSELVTSTELIPQKDPPSEQTLVASAPTKESLANSKDGENKPKKRKADSGSQSSNKKVVAPHLQFWTNRAAELRGIPTSETPSNSSNVSSAKGPRQKESQESVENAPPSRSFADMKRKCCLLCSRQFKTEEDVNKHERL